jgi:uncharacterized cofD-like protein
MNIASDLMEASRKGGADIREVYRNFKSVMASCAGIGEMLPCFLRSGIVLIGGGSGTSTVGRSLYRVGISNFTSIASVMDVGGGSGVVQEAFGVPHVNDVIQHLVNMNPEKNDFSRFMSQRTSNEWKQDGYILLAVLIGMFGMERGVDVVSYLLGNKHRSLPIADKPCEPIFTYQGIEYGTYGFAFLEGKISTADDIRLDVQVNILPGAAEAIQNADVAILGPGDVHFSVLPPMLVHGTYEALSKVRKIILVSNLTARRIDIPGFTLRDFVSFWKERLPENSECHVVTNSFIGTNLEESPLKDDICGDRHAGCFIHRAPVAGVGMSRNRQLLHDEEALGKALKSLIGS